MNIINKLTIRQLKLNKKRTLITIIGVIISVAMITAVATLGISYLDLMKRQVIANDGEWHVLYSNVNKKNINSLKDNSNTESMILSKEIGYSYLKDSKNKRKPYLCLKAYNSEGFNKFPVKLTEGRFPNNSNEIVIPKSIINDAKIDYRISDTLNIGIGKRVFKESKNTNISLTQDDPLSSNSDNIEEFLTTEFSKSYKIVGIIEPYRFEPTSAPGYTVFTYLDENELISEDRVNVSIILKKVNNKLFDEAKNIASDNNIEKVSFNTTLLRYYGVIKDDLLKKMLVSLSTIIMIIIMIGSISLIHNAFSISVSERSRYLGMLSSIGATKTQKRNSVFFEGLLIGIISIPLGIVFGLGGIGVTFIFINSLIQGALGITENFKLVISPLSIFVALIVSLITLFISTYRPARLASKLSAIDAIRQTSDLKTSKKEVKTSILTSKLFGIEGDLALRNIKRNRSRYRSIVFSLIISLILFLSVTSFTDSLKKSVEMTLEGVNFDLQMSLNIEDENTKAQLINNVSNLNNISQSIRVDTIDAKTLLNEESLGDHLRQSNSLELEDGKYPYYLKINALDDSALESYSKEVGVDYNKLKNTKNPAVIVIDTVTFFNYENDKYVEVKAIKTKIGEKMDLTYYNFDIEKNEPLTQINIAAITDKVPTGIQNNIGNNTFNIVVSKEVFNKIKKSMKNFIPEHDTNIFMISPDPASLQLDLEKLVEPQIKNHVSIYNVYKERQKEEQLILLISIFVYGFIALITSISIANIFNTISTSISLRRTEFAMLKSVGMTPRSFNKMINYESIFYGIKSLFYGLPISFIIMYIIHTSTLTKFDFKFTIPYKTVLIAIMAIFIIVVSAMLYSSSKVKQENIIDSLKKDFI